MDEADDDEVIQKELVQNHGVDLKPPKLPPQPEELRPGHTRPEVTRRQVERQVRERREAAVLDVRRTTSRTGSHSGSNAGNRTGSRIDHCAGANSPEAIGEEACCSSSRHEGWCASTRVTHPPVTRHGGGPPLGVYERDEGCAYGKDAVDATTSLSSLSFRNARGQTTGADCAGGQRQHGGERLNRMVMSEADDTPGVSASFAADVKLRPLPLPAPLEVGISPPCPIAHPAPGGSVSASTTGIAAVEQAEPWRINEPPHPAAVSTSARISSGMAGACTVTTQSKCGDGCNGSEPTAAARAPTPNLALAVEEDAPASRLARGMFHTVAPTQADERNRECRLPESATCSIRLPPQVQEQVLMPVTVTADGDKGSPDNMTLLPRAVSHPSLESVCNDSPGTTQYVGRAAGLGVGAARDAQAATAAELTSKVSKPNPPDTCVRPPTEAIASLAQQRCGSLQRGVLSATARDLLTAGGAKRGNECASRGEQPSTSTLVAEPSGDGRKVADTSSDHSVVTGERERVPDDSPATSLRRGLRQPQPAAPYYALAEQSIAMAAFAATVAPLCVSCSETAFAASHTSTSQPQPLARGQPRSSLRRLPSTEAPAAHMHAQMPSACALSPEPQLVSVDTRRGRVPRSPAMLDATAQEMADRAVALAVRAEQERSAGLLNARVAEVRAEAVAAKEDAASAAAELEMAKGVAAEASGKLTSLQMQVGNLRKEATQLACENEALRSQLDELETAPLAVMGFAAPRKSDAYDTPAATTPSLTARGGFAASDSASAVFTSRQTEYNEAAALAAVAAAYGVDPRLVAKVRASLRGFESNVPAGSYNEEHTTRVISAATAAVLATEGNVAMPPAPPSLAPLSTTTLAAAEAAYELQCAVSPIAMRGSSRTGSRVPDFYRAWMEEQLEHFGLGAAEASVRALHSTCPSFSPPSSACCHALPSGEAKGVSKFAAAFPQVHAPHAYRLGEQNSSNRPRDVSNDLATRPIGRLAVPPPTPADSRGWNGCSAFGGHVSPMVAGMLQHEEPAVREAAQQVLEGLRKLPLPPSSAVPTTPIAVPRPHRRTAQAQHGQLSQSPQSTPLPQSRRQLGNSATTTTRAHSVGVDRDGTPRHGQNAHPPAIRTALGPSPPPAASTSAAAVESLGVLTTASEVLGADALPLHGLLPVLGRMLEHADPPVRTAALELADALRRLHGDEPILGALRTVGGVQTLSAMRRAPPPQRPACKSADVLAAATSGLATAVAAFGGSVVHLPFLLTHVEPQVCRAAAPLADLVAKAASIAAANGAGVGRDGVQFEVKANSAVSAEGIPDEPTAPCSCRSSPLTRDRKSAQLRRAGPFGAIGARVPPSTPTTGSGSATELVALGGALAADGAAAGAESEWIATEALMASPATTAEIAADSTCNPGGSGRAATSLELSGVSLLGARGAEVQRSKPTPPRQKLSPPKDLTWKAEHHIVSHLNVGARESASTSPAFVDYIGVASRTELHSSNERNVPARAKAALANPIRPPSPPFVEPARPATSETTLSAAGLGALRQSASVGAMPSASAVCAIGDNMYLQKLPPVLRRSVCGTGARQHTRAVYQGER